MPSAAASATPRAGLRPPVGSGQAPHRSARARSPRPGDRGRPWLGAASRVLSVLLAALSGLASAEERPVTLAEAVAAAETANPELQAAAWRSRGPGRAD